MRLSRKVLWVVLSSLFFNDIWKNCTRDKAMDVCLRVLKESSKSRFNSYSVRNSELIVSHITFRDCRAHIFSDNLSRIIEIAKFVEISHLLRKSCLLLFCFHGQCQNDLERRNSQHTRFTRVRTNIWTDDFFYLCNLFTRLHVYTEPFKFFYRLQYRLHVKSQKLARLRGSRVNERWIRVSFVQTLTTKDCKVLSVQTFLRTRVNGVSNRTLYTVLHVVGVPSS